MKKAYYGRCMSIYGTARETQWAYDKKIPILELPSDIKSRTISIEATREYLREVGQR